MPAWCIQLAMPIRCRASPTSILDDWDHSHHVILLVIMHDTHAAGDANEVLNSRAVAVMTRMSDKLMGRDYVVEGMAMPMESDGVHAQVG
jgi:hypothetical protein